MATAVEPVRCITPVRTDFPGSFDQAMREGWQISSERTTLSKDEKERHGVVILGIKGRSERLSVSYTGSTGATFQFATPKPIK
jgi:hypothetical protein